MYLKHWNVNNLCRWEISQKFPVSAFKWVDDTSQSSKDFVEQYNEDSDEGYFLEVDLQYLENLHNLHNYLLFCLKEWKLKNLKNLWPTCMIKKNMSYTRGI